MNVRISSSRLLTIALGFALSGAASASPFVYQGTLSDGGRPATGRYDLQLQLYRSEQGLDPIAEPLTFPAVEVRNGVFRVETDVSAPAGADRAFVAVAVRDSGSSAKTFSALPGRESVKLAPTVIGACWSTTGDSGSTPGTNFIGTTDDVAFLIRASNRTVARFTPASDSFFGYSPTVVLGYQGNSANAGPGATIGGGGFPNGQFHIITGTTQGATISGGIANVINGAGAAPTIAGGLQNFITGTSIAGSAICGGSNNTATNAGATICGGSNNRADGANSAVLGGSNNVAGGDFSLAAGQRAGVRGASAVASVPASGDADGDEGTFVWADVSSATPFISSGPNQFLVRADGGVGINAAPVNSNVELTATSNASGTDNANIWLRQRAASGAGILFSGGGGSATAGSNNASFFIDHYNGTTQARRLELNGDGSVVIRSNITAAASGVTMASGGGSFSSLSDRNVKHAVKVVEPTEVLDRLLAMPVSTWTYDSQDDGIRHMGPMAQDFAAAFGLGEDETHIATVDADGVALAAIQGLNVRLQQSVDTLTRRNAELEAQIAALARDQAEERAANAVLRTQVEAILAERERTRPDAGLLAARGAEQP